MTTTPTAEFQLSLLGRFDLKGPSGALHLGSKKLSALLAYVSCAGPRGSSREQLTYLFWGSHSEEQARQNLRQALTRLRRTLGPDILISDGDMIAVRTDAIACDALRLESLGSDGNEDSLREALELYRGPFLADLEIPEEAWREWVGVERGRLESLALDAMVRLGTQLLQAGRGDEALSVAHRALAFSNLREDAHRLLIQALAAQGRRAEALRHYDQLVRLLRRELSTDPDAATTAMATELRTSTPSEPTTPLASDSSSPVTLSLPDTPSIAVLPFANMSGDPEQEYFADGMVDDILMALSRVRWLFVIARQSSFIYRTRSADVQQIGRELGVRYVVEGSVRKSGTRVRVVAQLIETGGGAHLWADRLEGDLRDIFALQDAITERIVSAVEEKVRDAEIRRARAKPTESLTAYDFYLRALPAWFGQTLVEYQRTQALLGKALDADHEYAEALGLLTDSVCTRTMQGWHESWSRGVDEASLLAGRALAAGPDNSTCLVTAAFTCGVLSNRFEEGLELANRAIMVHPNSVFVCNRAAAVYGICGESDKAIAQCEAAIRMNPLDSKKAATQTYTTLSFALYMARRYEESVRAGRRALAFAPQSNNARKYVATSLAQLGRTDEARAEIAELLKHQPGASLAFFEQVSFGHKWMKELHMEGLRKAGLR
jgi:TolB-like protein/predicted Zn-dependent protease